MLGEFKDIVETDSEDARNAKAEKEAADRENRLKIQKKRMNQPDYSENMMAELDMENLKNFYERVVNELDDYWDFFPGSLGKQNPINQ